MKLAAFFFLLFLRAAIQASAGGRYRAVVKGC